MNQTKINNIIERGGVEGWDDGGNLDALTKSFEFDTYEHAQHFVQIVGQWADKNDHHPEWNISNGGRTVNVRLTSHFANNTVTLYDFELAEQMNKLVKSAVKYNQYQRFSERQMVSLGVAVGSVALLFGTYTYLTAKHLITPLSTIRGQAPMGQVKGESDDNQHGFSRHFSQNKVHPHSTMFI